MGGKIFFAAILVMAFVAIALSPVNHAALYEDQLYELDLFSRCNDIGRDIKSGNVSAYTRRHLAVLKEELSALAPEDPSLQNVNQTYIDCIALLAGAADSITQGDVEAANCAFSEAETRFTQAERQLSYYKRAFGQED